MLHVCNYLVTSRVAMISNQIFNKVTFFFPSDFYMPLEYNLQHLE